MSTTTWLLLSIPILPNLWCIWHAFTHEFPKESEKRLWVLAGIFLPVIGGLAYLLIGWRKALPSEKLQTSEKSTNNKRIP